MVVFRGGTSGNRQDGLPPVPSSGGKQEVVNTATSGAVPSSIQFTQTSGNKQQANPDVPTGCKPPDKF